MATFCPIFRKIGQLLIASSGHTDSIREFDLNGLNADFEMPPPSFIQFQSRHRKEDFRQCDQTAKLYSQFLVEYSIEYLHNSIKS